MEDWLDDLSIRAQSALTYIYVFRDIGTKIDVSKERVISDIVNGKFSKIPGMGPATMGEIKKYLGIVDVTMSSDEYEEFLKIRANLAKTKIDKDMK